MTLLDVQQVRHSFGGLVALDQVSFRVEPGQIKGLIGPNGAGKTTLFNIISGLLKPDQGRVTFHGAPIHHLQPFQIARRGLSRTFQNPSLFLHMTVLENVMVGRHCRSHAGFGACAFRWPGQRREEREIRDAALAQLEHLDLVRLAGEPAGSLAFGQRRMVELARALATTPELLLLDEPASGLNTREKEDLAGVIRRIRDRGVTMLLVEHDMSLVMALSDDILVLHNGTPIAEGSPSVIQADSNVVRVYLGGDFEHAVAGQKSEMRLR
ncbi:MAG: ABC transporter ATP-binding protein [Verrucomicrobia bacterium]|nr:ABC transporter ATP-binding protein [Verrucomicrobiota bacterium]